MSQHFFQDDPYLQEAQTTVRAITPEGGILVEKSLFYPTGGGQPGDSGRITWAGGQLGIATAVKDLTSPGAVVLVPSEPSALPSPGTVIHQVLDWTRRHRHMRVHTALHLLSVVIPLPVAGGQISAEKGRLDFDMPEPPEDIGAIEDALNDLIERDLLVSESFISDDDLRANPGLVKTMSVAPPMGQGRVRLIRIGTAQDQIDLQPCGGTHVARTAEIGRVRIGKIEKKGKVNRRVPVFLDI